MLSHFSPAPVKTDRVVRIQKNSQVKVILKAYNEILRLIDWFAHCWENCPTGIILEWL